MSTAPSFPPARPALILVVKVNKAIDKRAKGQIADMFGEEPSALGMQTGGQDDLLPRGGSHSFPAPGRPSAPPPASAPSLFSEPASAPVQPNAGAGVQTDAAEGMPRRGVGRFRGVPKLKGEPVALKPTGLGGLFDETVHPRAGTGATTVNPETGKIISGGQFAPNPLAASRRFRDKQKRGQDTEASLFGDTEETNDNGHADTTDAGHSGDGTAGADALGAGVPRKSGKGRFRAVRNAEASGETPIGGLFGAGEREGHGSDADTEGNGTGAGPADGVGAIHSDAEPAGTNEHEPVIAPPLPSPAAPLMGTSNGVGFNAPQKTGNDYRISDEDGVGKGGDRAKFEANLAALRVLNDLQPIVNGERMGKGREATPEEQAILVKYSGWGWGGQKAFNPYAEPLWRGLQNELRPLLTDREYNEARASTDNAHYTAPAVIRGLWEAARHLGFSGGRILEPAAGIGHFCGLMPSDLWAKSQMGMVEIDPLSAAITSHLYQSAKTFATGFQDAPLPDNYFDLAISNVPFGNVKVTDKAFLKSGRRWLTQRIHDYFFAKALDKVRPGGGIVFITSMGTMDKKDDKVRKYLSDNAELVGAIRLPKNTFGENAGTDVTTDVLFLRKRDGKETTTGESWTGLASVEGADGTHIAVNEYFARHPEMMLGKMANTATRYNHDGEPECVGDGRDIGAAMQEAISKLPEGVLAPAAPMSQSPLDESDEERDWGHIRVGSYHVDEHGTLFQRTKKGLEASPLGLTQARIVRNFVRLRDTMHAAYDAMLTEGSTDEQVTGAQSAMGTDYDAFIAAHGPLHNRANIKALADDPDMGTVLGLEKIKSGARPNKAGVYESGDASKSDVFTQRTLLPSKKIDTVANVNDALMASLSETGDLDWGRMAQLTNSTPEALQAHFLAEGLVFENPEGAWETHDAYLSGNVRQKLKAAQAAAALDPRFQKNVDALAPVIPPDRTPGWITPNLGANWIPPSDVADFAANLMGFHPNGIKISYNPASAKWSVNGAQVKYAAGNAAAGAGDYSGVDLLECALNDKKPTVMKWDKDENGKDIKVVDSATTAKVHDKIQAIHDKFRSWVWKDEGRTKRLLETYNERFNGERLRHFDGQHLTMPGLSAFGQKNLRPFVKDTIWRIIQSPSTLLAHEVGSGKSWCFSGACMEMRRMGTAKKPMIVVPNDLAASQQTEFLKMYPNAKLLVADPADMSGPVGRQQFLAKAATGDWDAVIVPQSVYSMIPMSHQARMEHLQSQIDDMDSVIDDALAEARDNGEDDPKKNQTVKDLSKTRDNWVAKMQELQIQADAHKDEGLTFEKLGVDALLVDEAHFFKSLPIATRLQRVKGITNAASASQRANDMEMKVRHVQKQGNGGRVVMATGTPVSNTMCEAYIFQRYLDPDGLKAAGIEHFDAWAKNFGVIKRKLEYHVTGGVKETDRFSEFVNVGDMSRMFHKFAEVKKRKDLGIAGPKVNIVPIACPQSPAQNAYLSTLAARMGSLSPFTRHIDNALKINTDGKKNSLDHRLINPNEPDHEDSKVSKCVSKVAEVYRAGNEQKLTQLIFCDMGTPKKAIAQAGGTGADGEYVPQGRADFAADGAGASTSGRGVGRFRGPKAADGEAEDTGGEEVAGASGDEEEAFSPEEQQNAARLYDDIKTRLVAQGIPAHEIAFIQDIKNNTERRELQDAMNEGRIRVLLGSRKKMAQGLNVQRLCKAIHDLDVPDTPASLTQGHGRADRPGNLNEEVDIYPYVSQGSKEGCSYDAVSNDRLYRKQTFIDQFMDGDPNMSRMEDISDNALGYADLAALAAGKPEMFEYNNLNGEVSQLKASREGHENDQYYLKGQIAALHQKAQNLTGQLPYMTRLSAWRASNKPEGFVAHLADGRVLDKAGDFAEYVHQQAASIGPRETKHLADYGGFRVDLSLEKPSTAQWATPAQPMLTLTPLWDSKARGDEEADAPLTFFVPESVNGVVPGIQSALNKPEAIRAGMQKDLDEVPTRIKAFEAGIEPWPKEEEYTAKQQRLSELSRIIAGKPDEKAVEVGAEVDGDAPVVKGVGRFRSRLVKAGSPLVDPSLNLPGRVNQTMRSRRGNYHGLSVDESDRYDALAGELQRKKDAKRTGPVAKEFAGLHARRVAAVPSPVSAAPEKPLGAASSPIPSGARRFRDTGGETVARIKPERRAETKPAPASPSYSMEDYSGSFSRRGGTWSGSASGVKGGKRFRGGGPPAQQWMNDSPPAASATSPAPAKAGRFRDADLKTAEGVPPSPTVSASVKPAASAPDIDMNHLAATHKMTIADTQSQSKDGQARQAHLLTHRTPQAAADNLYRTLRSTGHNLSPVSYSRQKVDGHTRHVYSFHFQHGSGTGPIHTVNVVRPRQTGVVDVPRAPAVKPARKFKPGASGGVGFVPRRASGTAR